MGPSVARELHHFLLLSHDEQAASIRRLAAGGMSEQTIAAATRLSVEMVRLVLEDRQTVAKCRETAVCQDAGPAHIAPPTAPESATD